VTSMRDMACSASRDEVVTALVHNFGCVFGREMERL
jgi:hypothetical protein